MPNIYITTNLTNKKLNIIPYLYIGSDQNDNNNYFGSSKSLKEDIKKYGKESFKKEIIIYFEEIDNVSLRNKESEILKERKCAENPIYYNKTNTSHKGYFETEDEKKIRMSKVHDAFKKWIVTKTKEERHLMWNTLDKYKGKTTYEIMCEKYSEDIVIQKKKEQYEKITGEKNGMAVYSDQQRLKVIELFLLGNSRVEIAKITGVSYGIVKREINKYKKLGY